ncbi:MAG: DUF4365 domain-containing protein [Cellulomonadaceae bacterium]|nr:DUF4365 domain-containing protein [Cellulomonadaceae bacterium]
MDSKDVEQLAVGAVKTVFAHVGSLAAYIDENDKTPVTDGRIDLHQPGKQRTNATRLGSIQVQVKGRVQKAKSRSGGKFRLKKETLNNFQSEDGVLLLVVDLNPSTRSQKCYYNNLSPFKIKKILRESKPESKSFSVSLKPLPTSDDELHRLVYYAWQSQKEADSVRFNPGRMAYPDGFRLVTSKKMDFSQPMSLDVMATDFTLFATYEDGGEVPIDGQLHVVPHGYLWRESELTFEAGVVKYHLPQHRQEGPDTHVYQLGECITYTRGKVAQGTAHNFHFKPAGSLASRRNAVEFMVALRESSSFAINGTRIKAPFGDQEGSSALDELREFISALCELFEYLSVDVRLIDLDELDDHRIDQLLWLHGIILQGVPAPVHDTWGRVQQPVGRWVLELATREDETTGTWVCEDIFGLPAKYQYLAETKENGETVKYNRITPYELLDHESLPQTLNLNLGEIEVHYEAIMDDPEWENLANSMVVRLIHAADRERARRDEFLDGAERLIEFVISRGSCTASGPQPQLKINWWQILARRDGLDQETVTAVRTLRTEIGSDADPQAIQALAACAVLLGERDEAAYQLGRLDDECRDTFMTWPIYSLMNPDESPVRDYYSPKDGEVLAFVDSGAVESLG